MERHPGLLRGYFISHSRSRDQGTSPGGNPYLFSIFNAKAHCILRIHLDEGMTFLLHQSLSFSGHGSGVVMVQNTSRHHDKRIFLIRKFRTGHIFCGVEPSQTSGELTHMQNRCAGMFLIRAGPLDTLTLIQSSMADTCKAGSQGRDLIHDLFGSKLGLRISHTVHQVDKNIGIQAHLAFQCHRFTYTLYSSLRIAEGAFLLRITGTGQDHIRILRGLCHEQIGQHQEIQAFQCLADMMLVCIRYDRVFAEDKESADLLTDCRREYIRCMYAGFFVQLHSPCFFKFSNNLRICHFLITGEITGQCTHIAGTLHVILST